MSSRRISCRKSRRHQLVQPSRACTEVLARRETSFPLFVLALAHSRRRFVLQSREEIARDHASQDKELADDLASLSKKAKYLEKQVTDANNQLKDIVGISNLHRRRCAIC